MKSSCKAHVNKLSVLMVGFKTELISVYYKTCCGRGILELLQPQENTKCFMTGSDILERESEQNIRRNRYGLPFIRKKNHLIFSYSIL